MNRAAPRSASVVVGTLLAALIACDGTSSQRGRTRHYVPLGQTMYIDSVDPGELLRRPDNSA